ncbi:kinase-like domain-containing protein [Xylariaceae sp. FL1272]|nr:kinase-like domain-containing protein [Xylariaceae sp. FL1272]
MDAAATVNLVDSDDENAKAEAQRLKQYFGQSRKWQSEKVLGSGAYGVALLLKRRDAKYYHSRIVLKRSINADGTEDLKTEIRVLRRLRGSRHFCQLLAACDDLATFINTEDKQNLIQHLFTVSRRKISIKPNSRSIFKALNGLSGPAMLIEYFPNGTLKQLRERIARENIMLPNRVLWEFYLCLIRGCIGLMYPMDKLVQAKIKRREKGPFFRARASMEAIPLDINSQDWGGIAHNDISGRNIMIGDRHILNHPLVPELAMIDFGNSSVPDDPQRLNSNLNMCATFRVQEMIRLITRREPVSRSENVWQGHRTRATDICNNAQGQPLFPNLDPELRNLLAAARRIASQDRPNLQETLNRVEANVRLASNEPPPSRDINNLISHLLYDAPPSPQNQPPPVVNPAPVPP